MAIPQHEMPSIQVFGDEVRLTMTRQQAADLAVSLRERKLNPNSNKLLGILDHRLVGAPSKHVSPGRSRIDFTRPAAPSALESERRPPKQPYPPEGVDPQQC
jgi:hypothetical protein